MQVCFLGEAGHRNKQYNILDKFMLRLSNRCIFSNSGILIAAKMDQIAIRKSAGNVVGTCDALTLEKI